MTVEQIRSLVAVGCASVCGVALVAGAWLGGPILVAALLGSGLLLARSRSWMHGLLERRLRALAERADPAGMRSFVQELASVQRGRDRIWFHPRPQLKLLARAALAAMSQDGPAAVHWLEILEPTVEPRALAEARRLVGVALLTSGCPAEAAPVFMQVLAESSCESRVRASADFHLGEALLRLGRAQDAQAHYHRALALNPAGELARQIRDRIENPPPPYR